MMMDDAEGGNENRTGNGSDRLLVAPTGMKLSRAQVW